MQKPLSRFVNEDSGAITVDYVVLTVCAMAVAIAAKDVLAEGLGFLAGTVNEELGGEEFAQGPGLTYTDSFANGASGWSGAGSTEIFGIGEVLGPIGGTPGGEATVTQTFSMDPNAETTTVNFDVYSLDGIEGDKGYIYVGGQQVGYVTSTGGQPSFVSTSTDENMVVEGTVTVGSTQLGGYNINDPNSLDGMTNVSITITDPGESVEIGFGSDADAGTDVESFAIDNFSITGLADPDAQAPSGDSSV